MPNSVTIQMSQVVKSAEICSPPSPDVLVRAEIEAMRMALEGQLQAECSNLAQARHALEMAADQFSQLQKEFFVEAEHQLVSLAMDVAGKILAQKIEAGDYKIDPIVSEALATTSGCKKTVVHLHPDDLASCAQATDASIPAAADQDIEFVADASVGRGECRLETSQGIVEATVEHQLKEISSALKSLE